MSRLICTIARAFSLILLLSILGAHSTTAKADAVKPAKFPLQISDNKRYLVDADKKPFLVVGDTAWSLITQLPEKEAIEYLDDRKKRGFNAIIVSLIEHKFTTKAPATIEGIQPFKKAGDFSQPNPAYFDHAYTILKAANERGIGVWLCPAYLGWDGNDEGWFREINDSGPKVLRAYGKFVGERYKDLPNIIWMVGGDYNVPKDKRWAGEELALGLRDGGARQLMTAHGGQTTAVATFGDRDWLAIDNVYSYKPDQWKEHRANYQNKPVRPSVLIEAHYENEYQQKTDPANIRRQAWWAMTNGAAGQFFGNAPLWHLGGPGYHQSNKPWRDALDLAGSRDHARLGKFFQSLPWQELVPDLKETLVTAGDGDGDLKITAARTTDGKLAVIYVPRHVEARRSFTLDLSSFAGPVSARWFNPAKDEPAKSLDKALPNQKDQKLTIPGNNGTDANDWVLVLTVTNDK